MGSRVPSAARRSTAIRSGSGFCAVFLLGLADWRRLWSLRNLDLLMLLSFSVSLWFFNHGNVFAAMPLVYPGFVWLIARCFWVGSRDRAPRGAAVWPVWLLVGATVFLAGFRIGLNVRDSNVIDVGLSGVIGADRIWHGESPYGNFPIEGNRPKCGPADANGEVRNRIQTNGRCEAADAQGDTYGPVAYEAYLPGYWLFGWSGKWDTLPAVHATSILWDLLCLLGLGLVGRKLGGPRLGATLAFAWAAWPFSQYASSSNTNDAIEPALLVWGFLFATSAPVRGIFAALASWTKFAPLLVAAVVVGISGRPPVPVAGGLRDRLPARDARRVLRPLPRAVAVARRRTIRAPNLRLPVRSRLALLDLGLAPVPRTGAAGSAPGAVGAHRAARCRRGRARLVAAPTVVAAACGLHRHAAGRLRGSC